MYPNHLPMNYNYPNNQVEEVYLYPTPYQEGNYYHPISDDLRFGGFQPSFPPSFPLPGLGQGQGPGFGQGQGQGSTAGPPTSPPPSFVPQQQAQAFAVDPGGIRSCLFRFTYVWLRGFNQFWFYPTFVGRNSVSGFRWTGFRWMFFGIDLRQIQSFTCF